MPVSTRRATILVDNQPAVKAIRTRRCRPGQCLVYAFHREVASLLRIRHGFKLRVVWVPGHTDVAGNELADLHAKRAAQEDITTTAIKILQQPLPRSAAALRGEYKHAANALREEW